MSGNSWTPRVKVYIAGPYSVGGEMSNTRAAMIAGDLVHAMGGHPVIPHLSAFRHLVTPRTWEEWMAIDRNDLATCDVLVRLQGESRGAAMEETWARADGCLVYRSVGALAHALAVLGDDWDKLRKGARG